MASIIDQNILLYILFSVTTLAIISFLWAIRLEWRIHKLTGGANGKSLEKAIVDLQGERENAKRFRAEMHSYLTFVEKRLGGSMQGIGVVRFNPFRGSGGNQSFAVAFIDEHGNGLLLSSIYARERMSVFAKPLSGFTSSYELSEEEREALMKAQTSLAKQPNT